MFESNLIVPNFRLLRAIRQDLLVTCYFINEGDTVRNVEIETSGAARAEIFPSREIKTRDTGTIKFTGSRSGQDLKFRLCFTNGTPDILYRDFIFSEKDKKIFSANLVLSQ
jgi:bifunctional ADP-heptose synthase (sugar kinase/adenylyltransferase)